MRAVTTMVVVLALMLATASAGTPQPLTPLVEEWNRFFAIPSPPMMRDGRPGGTIWNTSTWGARRIQLLVEGLDASGQRVRVFAFNFETNAGPR